MMGRSRGSWRRLAAIALLAIGLGWIGLDMWSGRRVDAEFRRLEQRYGSLDAESMVAPSVAASDNQARFVRAAAVLTLPGTGDSSNGAAVRAALSQFETQTEPQRVPEILRALVDQNQESIRLAGEARRRRQASWDADYAGGSNVPSWLEVRNLSQALYAAALLDLESGRADDAAGKIASGFTISASIRHEPALIAQLLRISVGLQHAAAVRRLIAGGEPSSAALQDLARSLADSRSPDPMRVGLVAELRYGNGQMAGMENGQVPAAGFPGWGGPLTRVGRPFVRFARVGYLRELERLIELQAGPRPRPAGSESSPRRAWGQGWISGLFTSGLVRAIDSGDRFNSALGVSEVGIALRRHRLDRGTYPDDLSALVPAYLPRLPIDPATGRPPAYARQDAGFTLKAEPIAGDSAPSRALTWTVQK